MLFNKNKYKSYISTIELLNIILIFIITILLTILSYIIFKNLFYTLIAFLIGIVIGCFLNTNRNIKAERMKMEIDIYEKIMEK